MLSWGLLRSLSLDDATDPPLTFTHLLSLSVRSIPPEAPLFLFGASSGGKMATYLGREGSFQLCDKASTRVVVSGILSQV